jgi:integrase/recombinase XerC
MLLTSHTVNAVLWARLENPTQEAPMNITEAIATFETRLRADNRSVHTIKSYLRDVRLFAGWIGEGTEAAAIRPEDLISFAAGDALACQAGGAPRTPSTVNKIKASLRAFFQHLAEIGAIAGNPSTVLKLKNPRPRPAAILNPEEQSRLVESLAADGSRRAHRDRVIVELLLSTGLRLGSLVNLDIEDVDLGERRVLVRLKGGDAAAAFIKADLVPLIGDYLAELAAAGHAAGPLFRSNRNRRISGRQVQCRFKMWLARAGIETGVSVHGLRHGFATRLYRHTKDIRLVQHALGHRFITTTQIYLHVADCDLEAAIDTL